MEQMHQFMRMFTSQQLIRLSAEFPPRERSEPILPRMGMEHRPVGSSEFELEPKIIGDNTLERRPGAQANRNQPSFPVPKLDVDVLPKLLC